MRSTCGEESVATSWSFIDQAGRIRRHVVEAQKSGANWPNIQHPRKTLARSRELVIRNTAPGMQSQALELEANPSTQNTVGTGSLIPGGKEVPGPSVTSLKRINMVGVIMGRYASSGVTSDDAAQATFSINYRSASSIRMPGNFLL